MADLAKTFGKRLRAFRTERALSQAELAGRCQISEEWVRRIELGDGAPSFDMIETLSGELQVEPAAFFQDGPLTTDERLARAANGLDETAIDWLVQGARLLKRKSE